MDQKERVDCNHLGIPNVIASQFKGPDRFGEWLGYKVKEFDLKENRVVVELTLTQLHLSPASTIHGGVIAAFLDFSCGASVMSTLTKGQLCSTVEIKVNYFCPLLPGDHLISTSEIVFYGSRLRVSHARVLRESDQKLVAMATGTFNIFEAKEGRSG